MKKIPLIIDCDPGVDDAFAIILANGIEKFDVLAITSVSGNVDIDLTTKNALMITDLLNMDCVVARGAEEPLVKDNRMAFHTHGNDGVGGASRLFPSICHKELAEDNAVPLQESLRSSSACPEAFSTGAHNIFLPVRR